MTPQEAIKQGLITFHINTIPVYSIFPRIIPELSFRSQVTVFQTDAAVFKPIVVSFWIESKTPLTPEVVRGLIAQRPEVIGACNG